MNYYIYIDYENMSDLKKLSQIHNSRFFIFVGANQTYHIPPKPGIRIKKIKAGYVGKNRVDCELIDNILKRRNLKNTKHLILSKDKGFDNWIKYINADKQNESVKRYEKLEDIEKRCKAEN